MILHFLEKQKKIFWLFLFLFPFFLVLFAHYFFQNFLFMKPCEQCVLIRFDMLLVSFGAVLALINRNFFIQSIAFLFCFFGIYNGLTHSFILQKIYTSLQDENPFNATSNCNIFVHYPFNLPLERWFPDWFMPTGECGNDKPFVPKEEILNPLQEFFIGKAPFFEDGLYSNGWYLIPQLQFITMAQFCIFAFIICTFILVLLFINTLFYTTKK
ncbi:disulfide bond formation protein B [Campylobacter sp. MIT 21-1685]|uniref:disulfide bond formation protein B n=1 Tax=unclassified Campylobacter TaxID=2593542 RepID=UPI00224B25A6|nr:MULTISPECIES: disulfide bond formation protein B [unclassified Campylobacter]MCX2682956.1 disulfide bond formation protein B [Campylobacter sp. MIT 21-1684]MCX2751238.1 disulfide bond formation protein B [Campylobacter sp. MIT 21-1682]MCX2807437.1 disulfide bond formation protein B [Campylobacter sp. MIT 21-1685]